MRAEGTQACDTSSLYCTECLSPQVGSSSVTMCVTPATLPNPHRLPSGLHHALVCLRHHGGLGETKVGVEGQGTGHAARDGGTARAVSGGSPTRANGARDASQQGAGGTSPWERGRWGPGTRCMLCEATGLIFPRSLGRVSQAGMFLNPNLLRG